MKIAKRVVVGVVAAIVVGGSAMADGPSAASLLADGSVVYVFTNTTATTWTAPFSGTADVLLGGGGGNSYTYSKGMEGGLGGGGTGAYTYSGNNGRHPATAGEPNTGGGGGGGGVFGNNSTNLEAADGGSGVVIIRYALAPKGLILTFR